MPESRIDDLNPEQLRAATRARAQFLPLPEPARARPKLLRRAWLGSCRRGSIPPGSWLLTFTRRASDEMLHRARRALGETGSRTLGTIWGGTFHPVANRLLRTYGEAIGLDPDFTVMDQSDAEDLMLLARGEASLFTRRRSNTKMRWNDEVLRPTQGCAGCRFRRPEFDVPCGRRTGEQRWHRHAANRRPQDSLGLPGHQWRGLSALQAQLPANPGSGRHDGFSYRST